MILFYALQQNNIKAKNSICCKAQVKTAAAKIKTPMYESPVPRPDGIDEAAAFFAEPHQHIPFLAVNNITSQNKILL